MPHLRKVLRHDAPGISHHSCMCVALQQSTQIRDHTDLRVGALCGEMGVDWWDASRWQRVLDEHDVLVATPQVCCSPCMDLQLDVCGSERAADISDGGPADKCRWSWMHCGTAS